LPDLRRVLFEGPSAEEVFDVSGGVGDAGTGSVATKTRARIRVSRRERAVGAMQAGLAVQVFCADFEDIRFRMLQRIHAIAAMLVSGLAMFGTST
jgi:hypothetical protein